MIRIRTQLTRAVTLAVAITMLAAGAAYADTVSNSIDNTVDNASETIALTAGGAHGSTLIYVSNTNAGNPTFPDPNNPCNLAGAASLSVSVTSSNSAVATAQLVEPTDNSVAKTTFSDCVTRNPDGSFPAGSDLIRVLVTPLAAGSATISIAQVSTTGAGTFYYGPATFNITVNPPPNSAPTTPGTPAADDSVNQGAFTLSWASSSDDGNPNPPAAITYTLQHKDADDAAFSNVATGLTSNSYAFTSGSPEAEGTWTYRVQASDGALTSAFSSASASIVVDRTAPSAPTATVSGTSFTVGATDWYKDTATVTYSGSTDGALPDGSAGSGVASYSGPDTYTTNGANSYSGTATDAAGNVSDATSGTVHVDSANPTATITAPSGNPVYILGSSHAADYECADAGGSGVASCVGTVGTTSVADGANLPTNAVGSYSLTVTATDNVGHTGSASASYSVIYDFAGFFRPIDNLPTLNTVKAGQAIPVKFSLNGYQGLGIFAAGFPTSKTSACDAAAAEDTIEETVTAGGSSLSYDATVDQYVYVWKTDKSWAGTCRTLTVKLNDGTIHQALFKLMK